MTDPAERLRRLDACAVSDALDKLGLPGAVAGIERRTTARRIAGRVRTVKLGTAGDASSTAHLATRAIERAAAGDIVVVEQRTGMEAACWGGILTVAAKLRGVAGVIADGLVRDIDEAAVHDFPVFARGVTTRTARGRVVEIGTGVPVMVGDVAVAEGGYAIADGSGVVFIAAGDMERVLDAAETIAARERSIVAALETGTPASEAMDAKYERMLGD